MSILLIEDEARIVDLYMQVLEPLGTKVTVAQSAEEAIPHLKKKAYNLVIIDLMLPGMNGEDLIDKIITLENYEKINLVVLTNMGSGFNKDGLLGKGVKEVLLKLDIGPQELTNLVKKYCYY